MTDSHERLEALEALRDHPGWVLLAEAMSDQWDGLVKRMVYGVREDDGERGRIAAELRGMTSAVNWPGEEIVRLRAAIEGGNA